MAGAIVGGTGVAVGVGVVAITAVAVAGVVARAVAVASFVSGMDRGVTEDVAVAGRAVGLAVAGAPVGLAVAGAPVGLAVAGREVGLSVVGGVRAVVVAGAAVRLSVASGVGVVASGVGVVASGVGVVASGAGVSDADSDMVGLTGKWERVIVGLAGEWVRVGADVDVDEGRGGAVGVVADTLVAVGVCTGVGPFALGAPQPANSRASASVATSSPHNRPCAVPIIRASMRPAPRCAYYPTPQG